MARDFSLTDVLDTLNTQVQTALSPDTTTAVGQELINNITNATETPVLSDGGTSGTFSGTPFVILAASSNQWDNGHWGAFAWG